MSIKSIITLFLYSHHLSHVHQALLAFCKTLIELSRYQRFICNFSAAATERLAKRFPNYEVRIGSGLHVGWAIEGIECSNQPPCLRFINILDCPIDRTIYISFHTCISHII